MRLAMICGCLLLSCGMCLCAEETTHKNESAGLTFTPPLMGYVFDSAAGKLRMLAGIPGAARVADPVRLESQLVHAAIGAGGAAVVASVTGGASLALISKLDTQAIATPVENTMSDFNLAAFNSSGTAAVVYGFACSCIQFIEGIPDAPHMSRSIDAAPFSGKVQALALADTASVAAVAVGRSEDEGSPAQILLLDLRGDGAPRSLQTGASSLAFVPNGSDLSIAKPDSSSVSLSRNGESPARVTDTAAEGNSAALTSPSVLAFGTDGLLLVGDRSGFVHMIDLRTSQRRSIQCFCVPDSIERLKERSIYRLTGMETGAVWILDMGTPEPRTMFVPVDTPADAAAAETAQ